jgi:predicted RNA-binding protein YlxR (DUF448 family)
VTTAASHAADERAAGRERRCIVTGEVLPESKLVRFVADPDGRIVPDLAARLPGRGLWVSSRKSVLEVAVAKNQFSRAAKSNLTVPADLPARVGQQLVGRMLDFLGLARRSGALVQGFDAVLESLKGKSPPDVLVEAADGGSDGRKKLLAAAQSHHVHPAVIDCLYCSELSLALGRENVVHAAVKRGRFSERLRLEAGRLEGFRPARGAIEPTGLQRAGMNPALDEGRE